jgi:hypothetical protein
MALGLEARRLADRVFDQRAALDLPDQAGGRDAFALGVRYRAWRPVRQVTPMPRRPGGSLAPKPWPT